MGDCLPTRMPVVKWSIHRYESIKTWIAIVQYDTLETLYISEKALVKPHVIFPLNTIYISLKNRLTY